MLRSARRPTEAEACRQSSCDSRKRAGHASERLTRARAQVSIGDYDNKRYCSSVALQSATPARTQGAYAEFAIPLSQFNCPFAVSAASQVRARDKHVLR